MRASAAASCTAAAAQLWGALRSSRQLAALGQDALAEEVRRSVDLALARWRSRRRSVFQERFLALERARLEALLHEWLALERQRAPFEVARGRGSAQARGRGCAARPAPGPHRPARRRRRAVARLQDRAGARSANWFDPRPDEPQLPLYALTRDGPARRIGFRARGAGRVWFRRTRRARRHRPGHRALCARQGPRRRLDRASSRRGGRPWPRWASSSARAWSTVDPKRYPSTCDTCHLRTLCRVEELFGRAPEPDDAQDEES